VEAAFGGGGGDEVAEGLEGGGVEDFGVLETLILLLIGEY